MLLAGAILEIPDTAEQTILNGDSGTGQYILGLHPDDQVRGELDGE